MEDGAITKQDLDNFNNFVRKELTSHKEGLQTKFVEAQDAAKEGLIISK